MSYFHMIAHWKIYIYLTIKSQSLCLYAAETGVRNVRIIQTEDDKKKTFNNKKYITFIFD